MEQSANAMRRALCSFLLLGILTIFNGWTNPARAEVVCAVGSSPTEFVRVYADLETGTCSETAFNSGGPNGIFYRFYTGISNGSPDAFKARAWSYSCGVETPVHGSGYYLDPLQQGTPLIYGKTWNGSIPPIQPPAGSILTILSGMNGTLYTLEMTGLVKDASLWTFTYGEVTISGGIFGPANGPGPDLNVPAPICADDTMSFTVTKVIDTTNPNMPPVSPSDQFKITVQCQNSGDTNIILYNLPGYDHATVASIPTNDTCTVVEDTPTSPVLPTGCSWDVSYDYYNSGANTDWDVTVTNGIDCGAPPTGGICGVKFNDLNGNGVRDQGEPGLENWQIDATPQSGGQTVSIMTSPKGDYCMEVPIGNYMVSENQQAGWTQTAPASGSYNLQVAAGIAANADFGNRAPTKLTIEKVQTNSFGKVPGTISPPGQAPHCGANFKNCYFEITITNYGPGIYSGPLTFTDQGNVQGTVVQPMPQGWTCVDGMPIECSSNGSVIINAGDSVDLILKIDFSGDPEQNCAVLTSPVGVDGPACTPVVGPVSTGPGPKKPNPGGPCPPGALCPGQSAKMEPKSGGSWTPWLNRDTPGGKGDYETLSDFIAADLARPEPSGIDCATADGVGWQEAGQVYSCELKTGGICINSDQQGGRCLDYQVRFFYTDN